jgi:hypothetical protein
VIENIGKRRLEVHWMQRYIEQMAMARRVARYLQAKKLILGQNHRFLWYACTDIKLFIRAELVYLICTTLFFLRNTSDGQLQVKNLDMQFSGCQLFNCHHSTALRRFKQNIINDFSSRQAMNWHTQILTIEYICPIHLEELKFVTQNKYLNDLDLNSPPRKRNTHCVIIWSMF